MSRLNELINELCPEGVEYKTLGELGEFYGGLTGKSKNDFVDGNEKFITYMNVYKNLKLKLDVSEKVKINPGEKQRTLEYGDVLFTGSSETPDECGISSVLTEKTDEKLYLNSFCFIYRFNDKELFNPEFTKYLFRSEELRKQIGKTASGVTRFNVSKDKMKKIQIPVPPLPVQNEIVRILDTFTELETELETELVLRKKQYEYYRDTLLSFGDDVECKSLGEVSILITKGTTPKKFTKNGICFIKTEAFDKSSINKNKLSFIDKETHEKELKRSILDENDLLITIAGATIGKCVIVPKKILPANTNQALAIVRLNNQTVNYKYVYYLVKSPLMKQYIHKKVKGSAQPNLTLQLINEFKIPVPSLEKQKQIVDILDRFEALCNDLTSGLPAEIEARRKQYEYYRDKLLTFKRKDSV